MSDNELIADFMGVVETEGFYDSYGVQTPHYYTVFRNYRTRSYTGKGESLSEFFGAAKYHESWDWLMPVIEQISDLHSEKFEYDVDKIATGDWPDDMEYIDVITLPIATPIKEVYQKVVEFIKWYNSTK